MRASGRSTLFTTRITGSRAWSALRSTKRVCGSGPSDGVDEQQHAVDHRQAPLDLAAEVGVAGRVDDVDRHPVEDDRRVLGEDGDALLALEVGRVHDPIGDLLVGPEGARLPQQLVDQRRLAVVDVGDDGHAAEVVSGFHPSTLGSIRGTTGRGGGARAPRSRSLDPGAAVLVAPPGSGKSTVVPLRLLDEPWMADGGRIVVLQPRRVATRAVAARLACAARRGGRRHRRLPHPRRRQGVGRHAASRS